MIKPSMIKHSMIKPRLLRRRLLLRNREGAVRAVVNLGVTAKVGWGSHQT
jgi:hypothetical protein